MSCEFVDEVIEREIAFFYRSHYLLFSSRNIIDEQKQTRISRDSRRSSCCWIRCASDKREEDLVLQICSSADSEVSVDSSCYPSLWCATDSSGNYTVSERLFAKQAIIAFPCTSVDGRCAYLSLVSLYFATLPHFRSSSRRVMWQCR